jgi:hypothetical protein
MNVEWGTSPRGYREKKRQELRDRVAFIRARAADAPNPQQITPPTDKGEA